MMIVQKYGGTSLADAGKIRGAARRAAEKARNDATAFAIESARHTIREQNHSRKL